MTAHTKAFRNPIGRVRGLGSAREGTAHWLGMKITAVALVPLGIWFIISALSLAGSDYFEALRWFQNPAHGLVMLLFLGFGLYHSAHGVQVVIEDYLSSHTLKMVALVANILVHLGLAAAAALALITVLLKS